MVLNKLAIFLNTCDKNKDVCHYFLMAFEKFNLNNSLIKFAGINNFESDVKKYGFLTLPAETSNWQVETIFQLKMIKRLYPNISHILLILDDFILNKEVDFNALQEVIENITYEKYIRLKPLEEGMFLRIKNIFSKRKLWGNQTGIKIRRTHPYYASLQIAIWDIDYLIMCVENCKNIWDFETPKPYHSKHFATNNNLFRYKHIVEKGQWDVGAEKYCIENIGLFAKGTRRLRKLTNSQLLLLNIKKITFFLFGYSIMNIKRKMKL